MDRTTAIGLPRTEDPPSDVGSSRNDPAVGDPPVRIAVVVAFDPEERSGALRGGLYPRPNARTFLAEEAPVRGDAGGPTPTPDRWSPAAARRWWDRGYTHVVVVRDGDAASEARIDESLKALEAEDAASFLLVPGVNDLMTIGRAILAAHDVRRWRTADDAGDLRDRDLAEETARRYEPSRIAAPRSVAQVIRSEGLERPPGERPIRVAHSLGDRDLQKRFFVERVAAHFPMPQSVFLVLSNQCNLKCVMCPYHSPDFLKDRRTDYFDEKRWMPLELVDRLVDELERIKPPETPIIFHMGELDEPLLHPDLPAIVRRLARTPGAIVHITSNATILSEEKSRQLIEAGLGSVSFSVDAHTQETYTEIRGAKLSKTQRNVETFLRLRDEINPNLSVNLCIIEQRGAIKEIPDFTAHWREQGADSASVYKLFTPADADGNWKLDSRYFKDGRRTPCQAVWDQMFLYPGGEVSLCCTTLARVPQDGIIAYGNLNDRSVRDIWLGVDYQTVRTALIDEDFANHPYCESCNVWAQTYQYERVMDDGTRFVYGDSMGYYFYPEAGLTRRAARLAEAVNRGEAVAVWGFGTDFRRWMEVDGDLAAMAASGRLLLVDRQMAGRTFHGIPIHDPAVLATASGPVWLTPANEGTRASMRAAARDLGLHPERLVDPYAAGDGEATPSRS